MTGISAVTVMPSQARSSSGASPKTRVPANAAALAVIVDVTTVPLVSPNVTLTVEWSHDGVGFAPAEPADAFGAFTAPGSRARSFAVKGEWFRVAWSITGTPTPSATLYASAYGV